MVSGMELGGCAGLGEGDYGLGWDLGAGHPAGDSCGFYLVWDDLLEDFLEYKDIVGLSDSGSWDFR